MFMHLPALVKTVFVCLCIVMFFLCTVLGMCLHVYAFLCTLLCIVMHLCALSPQWCWTITCTIWLRLQFRGQGSAQNFGAHLLFFHALGRILEPRIGFWISRSTFRPGDLFGLKKWSPKKMRCKWIGRTSILSRQVCSHECFVEE